MISPEIFKSEKFPGPISLTARTWTKIKFPSSSPKSIDLSSVYAIEHVWRVGSDPLHVELSIKVFEAV